MSKSGLQSDDIFKLVFSKEFRKSATLMLLLLFKDFAGGLLFLGSIPKGVSLPDNASDCCAFEGSRSKHVGDFLISFFLTGSVLEL